MHPRLTWHKLLLCILTLASSTLLPDQAPQSPDITPATDNLAFESLLTPQLKEQIQDELEQLYKDVIQQLNGIDSVLQELALLINKNQITKKSALKSNLISSIKTVRKQIDQMRSVTPITIDIQSIYLMLIINNALIDHISAALTNNLKSIPNFDLTGLINKSASDEITLEKIEQLIVTNTQQLSLLSQQAANAGLHWYNHMTRKFNNYIIHPLSKYKIIKYSLGGGLATLLFGYYLEWDWAKKLLGPRPKYNVSGGEANNYEHLFKPGKIEDALIKLQINQYVYASAALTYLLPFYKYDAQLGLHWLKKQGHKLWNACLGGSYADKDVEDLIVKKEPTITFDDIVGAEHAKAELKGIINYMKDPERYDRNDLGIERGYLLTGPTRTGKSFMAEAIAGEVKKIMKQQGRNPNEFGYYMIKSSMIIKHGIENLIAMAKKEAPCILFIDEIDLLALQRVGGDRDMLSEFLIALSSCREKDPSRQVIIIGATNNPQNMDKALKQPGRFGKIIRFDYPGLKDRSTYLAKKLDALTVNVAAFDIEALAKKTEGYSFDHLSKMLRKALLLAKTTGDILNQELLEQALDTEIRNIILEERKELSDTEKWVIAVHQAGHALAHILLPTSSILDKITILPVLVEIKEEAIWETYSKKENDDEEEPFDKKTIQYGKVFAYHENDTLDICNNQELINRCKIELAGHSAEKIIMGASSYHYHNDDKQKAYTILKPMVFEGIKEKQLSEDSREKRYDMIMEQLALYEQELTELLGQYKDQLHEIAKLLLQKETVTKAMITEILTRSKN